MAKLLDDDRVLCVDGGCIGLVGADGRCKECGKAGPSGASAVRPDDGGQADSESWSDEFDEDDDADDADDDADDSDSDADDDDADDSDSDADDELSNDAERLPATDDFDERQLCPDGGCVGLIGPSGKCTTCGARPGHFEEE